jgi:hypothetical protein
MFFHKSNCDEAFNAEKNIVAMKRLTLLEAMKRLMLHRFIAVNTI